MIDSIPSANLAMPAIPSITPPPGQAVANQATGSSAHPSTDPASAPQFSFASTLQSRLKLMALNKTAVAPAGFATLAKQEMLPDLAIPFAELAKQTALVTASIVPPDAKDTALTDEKSSNARDNADSTGTVTIAAQAATDPATAVPLALNIASPSLQVAMPQLPKSPTAAASTKGSLLQDAATLANNNSGIGNAAEQTIEQVPAAVIATTPEKNALIAANPDAKTGDMSFAEVLRSSIPQAGVNPVQTQAPSVSPPMLVREVTSPFASTHWVSDVGNQLNWMVGQRESRADLVLNPPHLGRIEVSITLNGDKASASFVSSNPEVREVLQGSLPRLREVLADAGVFLGQANIGAESFRHGENGAEKGGKSCDDSFSPAGQSLLVSETGSLSIVSSQPAGRGQGLIDLFA